MTIDWWFNGTTLLHEFQKIALKENLNDSHKNNPIRATSQMKANQWSMSDSLFLYADAFCTVYKKQCIYG